MGRVAEGVVKTIGCCGGAAGVMLAVLASGSGQNERFRPHVRRGREPNMTVAPPAQPEKKTSFLVSGRPYLTQSMIHCHMGAMKKKSGQNAIWTLRRQKKSVRTTSSLSSRIQLEWPANRRFRNGCANLRVSCRLI